MKWKTETTVIDAETGEVLSYVMKKKEIEKQYRIIQTIKHTEYKNTEYGIREIKYIVTRRTEQYKLL